MQPNPFSGSPLLLLLFAAAPAPAIQLTPARALPVARTASFSAAALTAAAGRRSRTSQPCCVYSMNQQSDVSSPGAVRLYRGRRVLAGRLGQSSSDAVDHGLNASSINVAVLGGGSFGTAMSHVLGRKGVNVTLVVRQETVAASINENGTNTAHQSHVQLPQQVRATTDAAAAFADAHFIFHAVPVQFTRDALAKVSHLIPPGVPVISLSKGIETSSLMLMAEVLEDCLGSERPLAFLSGPAFASEIAEGLVTAVTIASADRELANDLMELLASTNFRALYSPDVVGVEVGGAVKNVIAIAAGMCEGLGLGTNAMAALVTRGCTEMRKLVVVCGGEPSTVFGLSGVGDTFGTCFGPLSRNRQVGMRLGRGETLEDILASSSEVAEGVATSRAITKLVEKRVKGYRRDLKYPILFGVAAILDGKITPREGLERLMEMPLRVEDFSR